MCNICKCPAGLGSITLKASKKPKMFHKPKECLSLGTFPALLAHRLWNTHLNSSMYSSEVNVWSKAKSPNSLK